MIIRIRKVWEGVNKLRTFWMKHSFIVQRILVWAPYPTFHQFFTLSNNICRGKRIIGDCLSDDLIVIGKSFSVKPFLQVRKQEKVTGAKSGEHGGWEINSLAFLHSLGGRTLFSWTNAIFFLSPLNWFNELVKYSPVIVRCELYRVHLTKLSPWRRKTSFTIS